MTLRSGSYVSYLDAGVIDPADVEAGAGQDDDPVTHEGILFWARNSVRNSWSG